MPLHYVDGGEVLLAGRHKAVVLVISDTVHVVGACGEQGVPVAVGIERVKAVEGVHRFHEAAAHLLLVIRLEQRLRHEQGVIVAEVGAGQRASDKSVQRRLRVALHQAVNTNKARWELAIISPVPYTAGGDGQHKYHQYIYHIFHHAMNIFTQK